jgi:DNA segregation ATPase FtsK/SpoIIIE-like protein
VSAALWPFNTAHFSLENLIAAAAAILASLFFGLMEVVSFDFHPLLFKGVFFFFRKKKRKKRK